MRVHNPPAQAAARRRPRNRRGDGARLRRDLLEAATAIVAETADPGQLSLRAVAARTGVAATSLYLHFTDLDQLKIALAELFFADLAAARDHAAQDHTAPALVLIARCQAYADYGLNHPGRYRLMFGPDLPPQLSYTSSNSPSRGALDSLTSSIRSCQQAGSAAADSDPALVAGLVWAALHGQVSLRTDRPYFPWPPLEPTVTELVRRLAELAPLPRRNVP